MRFKGFIRIIDLPKTVFLCSRQCPPNIILETYDWAIKMRDECKCVVSGFQSHIEKDVLKYFIKGTQPIIVVLARGMYKRLSPELSQAVQQRRILIMSPFKENVTRISEETALIRNRYMLDIADDVYIPFYSKGGLIEQAIRTSKFKESFVS